MCVLWQVYLAISCRLLKRLIQPTRSAAAGVFFCVSMNCCDFAEDTIFNHEKEKKLQEAISDCPTFSRLHFLLGIVESSVKWEKSAENAVRTSPHFLTQLFMGFVSQD